jgi:hypothetical protein
MQFNRMTVRALAGTAIAGAAILAGPAAAFASGPPSGGGSVSATVTIPATLTFSLATSAFQLTGSAGGPSSVGTVNWSLVTNDAGWSVSVAAASGSMTGTGSNHAVIPIGDVAVLPAELNSANGWSTPPSFANWMQARELSTSAYAVDTSTGPASTGTMSDYYAIPGAGALGSGDGGQSIPPVAADSYSDTLQYLALGN